MEELKQEQIQMGVHILRNDVVQSAWLEDKSNSQEKLESFTNSYNKESYKSKSQIIL